MLLHKRPELTVVPLRGNVDTRLGMVTSGEVDATFLALAGLNRLGRDDVPATPVPVEEMLPAVCQGIVGVERRGDDDRIAELLVRLNDADASVQAAGERELLAGLDGSCRTPIAAYGDIDGTDCVSGRPWSARTARNYWQPNGAARPPTLRPWDGMPPTNCGARAGPGFFDEP